MNRILNRPNKLNELVAEFYREIAGNKLLTWRPYPWQRQFYEAGLDNTERMLMAANGVGKTAIAGAEISIHMVGDYDGLPRTMKYPEFMPNGNRHPNAGELVWPNGWQGRRFKVPPKVWTGSPTNETSKQNIQTVLVGGTGEDLGTGFIPKSKIIGKPTTRQAGVKDVVDSFQVRHISGGISHCFTKTYEQGWQKWQGGAPHIVWLDEEPDDLKIYTEALTRILRTQGIVLVTYTPLLGWTDLSLKFRDGGEGIYLQGATWEVAPHLDEKEKSRLEKSYPPHEVDARTKGIPMMGEGAIFPISDDKIKCDPFPIPPHFARIKGCDFGYEHDGAGVDLAIDRARDIIYVIDCYKEKKQLAPYHAAWFTKSDTWVPVAWPHDGLNTEKSGGTKVKDAYIKHGVNMLSKSARYAKAAGQDKEKGGSQDQWPVIDEVRNRMMTDRFKVFSNLSRWFEEKRSYHVTSTNSGEVKIVARRDDILKATFYAVMMKRYAVPENSISTRRSNAPSRPITSAAL